MHFNQIQEASDDITMQQVYTRSMDLVLESGYNKPATLIGIHSKQELSSTLRLHFTLYRNKAVIDQLKCGLLQLGVLAAMCKYSNILRPLFLSDIRTPLTAGKVCNSNHLMHA